MFAPRNAFLAAMASSLVVVRSGPEGGTMITVDIAKRLGRPIYAIPGDPREKTSLGCLELLRSNIARPAWSANHVLGDLPPSRLSLIQQKTVNAIGAGRDHLDALMEDLDHECTEVHQAILELEFMGVITRLHGRYICAPMMLGELT
jgi:DNA processing protein